VTAFFGRGQKFVVSECSVLVPATWQFDRRAARAGASLKTSQDLCRPPPLEIYWLHYR